MDLRGQIFNTIHMLNTRSQNLRGSPKVLAVIAAACVLAVIALTGCDRGAPARVSAQKIKKETQAGRESYQKGDFDKAVKKLEAAAKDDPRNAQTQKTLGQSYEALGNLDAAAKAYRASLKEDSKQPQVLYNLAIIYKSRGERDKAIAELNKAIKANKQFSAAQIILGDLYAQKGEKEKAEARYRAVIDAGPFGIDLEEIKRKIAALQ